MPEATSTNDRIQELKVSGGLMTLEPGLWCIYHQVSGDDAHSGLPGVRISASPADGANPRLSIISFGGDGWISGRDDGLLVRVLGGPAQVLVTIYQAADGSGTAPDLQVMRLTNGSAQAAIAYQAAPIAPAQAAAPAPAGPQEVTAHIQRTGDIAVSIGDWIGEPGQQKWIEGFSILPQRGLAAEDIEYQAVLGRGWLSPWSEGGQFCGSRGMALPILGLRVQLRGQAAQRYATHVTATFTDGTRIGPVEDGELVEATSLAPLEAFQVSITDRLTGKAIGAAPIATPGQAPRPFAQTPAPAPAPRARPAAPAPKPAAPAPKPVAKAPAKPAKGGKAAPAAKSGKASTTRRG